MCLFPSNTEDGEESNEQLSPEESEAHEEVDPEVEAEAASLGHPVDDGSYDPDMIPGIVTGDDIVEFYAKYGQDSPVKFFYCNRCEVQGPGGEGEGEMEGEADRSTSSDRPGAGKGAGAGKGSAIQQRSDRGAEKPWVGIAAG